MRPKVLPLRPHPPKGTTVAGLGSVGEGVSPTLDAGVRLTRRW
jgi:hypothetical protein